MNVLFIHTPAFTDDVYASRVRGKRVQLANPEKEAEYSDAAKAKRLAKARRRRRKERRKEERKEAERPLSRSERKRMGLVVAGGKMRYASVLPLHNLWIEYMTGLLSLHKLRSSPLMSTSAPMAPSIVDILDEQGPSIGNGNAKGKGKGKGREEPPRKESDPRSGENFSSSHAVLASEMVSQVDRGMAASMQASLVKADYHGCLIEVTRAKSPSLLGQKGIVIQETENTFKIVTEKDRVQTIPKQNCVFTFAIPFPSSSSLSTAGPSSCSGTPVSAGGGTGTAPTPAEPAEATGAMAVDQEPSSTAPETPPQPSVAYPSTRRELRFSLYGNQFRYRAGERAGRKFKPKKSVEF